MSEPSDLRPIDFLTDAELATIAEVPIDAYATMTDEQLEQIAAGAEPLEDA